MTRPLAFRTNQLFDQDGINFTPLNVQSAERVEQAEPVQSLVCIHSDTQGRANFRQCASHNS
jgi:hypothetical protein